MLCAYGNCFQTTTSEWMASLNGDNDKHNNPSERMKSAVDYDHNGYLLPEAYARFASEWANLGVQIIGGCCGSTPLHMKKVASMLRS